MGPVDRLFNRSSVELLDRRANDHRVATYLVERSQRKITIEGRVLQPFSDDRAGKLLEFVDELPALRESFVGQARWIVQEQHRADKIEKRGAHRRIAPL